MKKRILTSLLSLFLIVGLLPMSALAAEGEAPDNEMSIVCTMTENCEAEIHDKDCPLYEVTEEGAANDIEESLMNEQKEAASSDLLKNKPNVTASDTDEPAIEDSWENCEECSQDNPHIISTIEDLDKIRTHTCSENGTTIITGYFQLSNDIVFEESDFAENGMFYNNGWGWRPIGHNDKTSYFSGAKFCGDFNGNNYAVKNLFVKRPADYWYNGLFAGLGEMAHIYNLTLDNFQINADGSGVLCGQTYGSDVVVENITVKNLVLEYK